MEAIQPIVDDPPSDFLQPQPPSSAFVASTSSDSASDGLLKKPKCSSSDESQTSIAVQENQEIGEDDLGSVKDVVLEIGGKECLLVDEEDMGLGKSELGFSGVPEYDEVHEILGSDLALSELGFSGNQEFDAVCKSSSSNLVKSELGISGNQEFDEVHKRLGSEWTMSELGFPGNQELALSELGFSGNQEFGEVHKSSSSDFAKSELGFSGTQECDEVNKSLSSELAKSELALAKSELGFSGTQELDEVHKRLSSELAKSVLGFSGTQEFDAHESLGADLAKSELGFSGTQEFDGGLESLGADLAKSELGFSATQEFDGSRESLTADMAKSELGVFGIHELDGVQKSPSSRSSCVFTAIEDHVVTSSDTFGENESELFLRNKEKQILVENEVESLCDTKNHVLKLSDCESSRSIVENSVKINEESDHSSNGEPERNANRKQIEQIVGEKLDGLKGVGGALSCSLKIEVIDDTAVIETFPASGFGVGCGKDISDDSSDGEMEGNWLKGISRARSCSLELDIVDETAIIEPIPACDVEAVDNYDEDDNLRLLPNMTRLKLTICPCHGWRCLLVLLRKMPNLTHLDLRRNKCCEVDTSEDISFVEKKVVPRCMSMHLEEVKITGFQGLVDEVRITKYILGNSKVLQKIAISFGLTGKGYVEFPYEVLRLPRAAQDCLVTVSEDTGKNMVRIGKIIGQKLDGLKEIKGALSCSLDMGVIYDKAVIDTVPACKVKVVEYADDYTVRLLPNVIRLHLSLCYCHGWRPLLVLLRRMPSMQYLDLRRWKCCQNNASEGMNYVGEEVVPWCLSKQLREVRIIGFQGLPEELRLLEFLVGNSLVLEKIEISAFGLRTQQENEFKAKLVTFRRGSRTCKVVMVGNDLKSIKKD